MLIPTPDNVKTITDMRANTLKLLDLVDKEGLTYIFHRSKPRAVMLKIDDFVRLQQLLEDYLDIQEAKSLAKEPRGKEIPLESILQKYQTSSQAE